MRSTNHEFVVIDDLHLLRDIADGISYFRTGLLDAVLTSALDTGVASGKKVLFGLDDQLAPPSVQRRSQKWEILGFSPEDYMQICRGLLGECASGMDFARIHKFAPKLTLWQLRSACASLARDTALNADRFIDHLREHNITGNVEIEEVRKVDWNDLKGMDDVVRALESKIALPFENHGLTEELHLRARRGVLLAGPPGTGKTTIGRALAHRLKGKFFLIDGTAIAGSNDFYEAVNNVFSAATQNAPSVIFIDDADVIFEGREDRGLYRYLLTKLDGIESESADRVCVMMTAMDAGSLPPALLRSGRIELWLETRLPDVAARTEIVSESLKEMPPPFCSVCVNALASASQGLTGADLRSVIEDGKLLFAYDKARGKTLRPIDEYFMDAVDTVRANRRNYLKRRPGPFGENVRIGFQG